MIHLNIKQYKTPDNCWYPAIATKAGMSKYNGPMPEDYSVVGYVPINAFQFSETLSCLLRKMDSKIIFSRNEPYYGDRWEQEEYDKHFWNKIYKSQLGGISYQSWLDTFEISPFVDYGNRIWVPVETANELDGWTGAEPNMVFRDDYNIYLMKYPDAYEELIRETPFIRYMVETIYYEFTEKSQYLWEKDEEGNTTAISFWVDPREFPNNVFPDHYSIITPEWIFNNVDYHFIKLLRLRPEFEEMYFSGSYEDYRTCRKPLYEITKQLDLMEWRCSLEGPPLYIDFKPYVLTYMQDTMDIETPHINFGPTYNLESPILSSNYAWFNGSVFVGDTWWDSYSTDQYGVILYNNSARFPRLYDTFATFGGAGGQQFYHSSLDLVGTRFKMHSDGYMIPLDQDPLIELVNEQEMNQYVATHPWLPGTPPDGAALGYDYKKFFNYRPEWFYPAKWTVVSGICETSDSYMFWLNANSGVFLAPEFYAVAERTKLLRPGEEIQYRLASFRYSASPLTGWQNYNTTQLPLTTTGLDHYTFSNEAYSNFSVRAPVFPGLTRFEHVDTEYEYSWGQKPVTHITKENPYYRVHVDEIYYLDQFILTSDPRPKDENRLLMHYENSEFLGRAWDQYLTTYAVYQPDVFVQNIRNSVNGDLFDIIKPFTDSVGYVNWNQLHYHPAVLGINEPYCDPLVAFKTPLEPTIANPDIIKPTNVYDNSPKKGGYLDFHLNYTELGEDDEDEGRKYIQYLLETFNIMFTYRFEVNMTFFQDRYTFQNEFTKVKLRLKVIVTPEDDAISDENYTDLLEEEEEYLEFLKATHYIIEKHWNYEYQRWDYYMEIPAEDNQTKFTPEFHFLVRTWEELQVLENADILLTVDVVSIENAFIASVDRLYTEVKPEDFPEDEIPPGTLANSAFECTELFGMSDENFVFPPATAMRLFKSYAGEKSKPTGIAGAYTAFRNRYDRYNNWPVTYNQLPDEITSTTALSMETCNFGALPTPNKYSTYYAGFNFRTYTYPRPGMSWLIPKTDEEIEELYGGES